MPIVLDCRQPEVHMRWATASLLIGLSVTSASVQTQENQEKESPRQRAERLQRGATVHVYKTVGDDQLRLYEFKTDGGRARGARAAIVLFHGFAVFSAQLAPQAA
jgi:hypothetical protein